MESDGRIPVLYLAPWVDYGGSDSGTIDWFRWLDRDRFRPSLITTQPSPNRRLNEILPYAAETWVLPELLEGDAFPRFILDFIETRGIRLLHIMNSRLGFDLLPDVRSLDRSPAVVVQLHVEEPDRSGYVRYVASRYGNLVDAFSVTSSHLAASVTGNYEVPESKCRVIYTGVDAERAFSPLRVSPVAGLEQGVAHILYPCRLVEQKDPLLMVQVAAALRRIDDGFRIHVVGDGALEDDVRAAVAERQLDRHVILHGGTDDVAPWYAAADAVLMTSTFEGVPYVTYEAMAMGRPVVAPALPGNVELLAHDGQTLVTPRDDPNAYAAKLAGLIADPELRRCIGERFRARARECLSLRMMADEHAELYEQVLAAQPSACAVADQRTPMPSPIRCGWRPAYHAPLVSVIIPCFNHGRWLPDCLASVRGQSYPALEIIVVDDGSTDRETLRLLDDLATDEGLTLIRLPSNQGPAAARNAGIERATGRYLLPVDADNLLVPEAVERMVEQIQAAGETVGYIYPNQHFFGARDDYSQAPAYNLYNLLHNNYCDTCALIDRVVFDFGARYDEHHVGHEDWDFALQLAERDVRGEPARHKTLMTRKWGFTRSDLVETGATDFRESVRSGHPALYERRVGIKARWAPALSIVALDEVADDWEARDRLMSALAQQTCGDFEIVVRSARRWRDEGRGPRVRFVNPGLAASRAEAIRDGVHISRGRFILVARGCGVEMLDDPAFVEKMLRTLTRTCGAPGAVALVDAGAIGGPPLRVLTAAEAQAVVAGTWAVVWAPATLPPASAPAIGHGDDLLALAHALEQHVPVQWRHLSGPPTGGAAPGDLPRPVVVRLRGRSPRSPAERDERAWRWSHHPILPGRTERSLRRIVAQAHWSPSLTRPLCRHVAVDRSRRITTVDREPAAGHVFDYQLGSINLFHLPGTTALIRDADGHFRVGDDPRCGPGEVLLGFLEEAPLPLFDPVLSAVDPLSGEEVLVAGGGDDPLAGSTIALHFLGWIEPTPLRPRSAPVHHPGQAVGHLLAEGTNGNGHGSAVLEDMRRLDREQLARLHDLEMRMQRIRLSIPGRVWRVARRMPGLKSVLTVTVPRGRE